MKNMEQKLKKLFDYQRFENNKRLKKLITDAEDGNANALSDDDLSFVNAAGDILTERYSRNTDKPVGSDGGGIGGGGAGGNGAAI